jgi:tRNA-dihydrouridine synthase B
MSVLPHSQRDHYAVPTLPLEAEPMGPAVRQLQIGSLRLNGRVLLAPLAGYTDKVFRGLARRFGAAMVATEMVSARALVSGNGKTKSLMEFSESERPVAVQLFGDDPAIMGEAAAKVAQEIKPDVIDVNFGCPVGKVLKSDSGAAILKDSKRAHAIVQAMVRATRGLVPVTVKTRAGFDAMDDSIFEVLKAVEEAGASALTLHARTRSQMFEGKADWEIVMRIKQQAKIPVIGNGDVKGPEDAYRRLKETGCDGIMIGRGSLGAPWIFSEINQYLETGKPAPLSGLKFRISVALEHLKGSIEVKGDQLGMMEMRKHLTHYLKGFEGAREMRQKLLTSNDAGWVIQQLAEFHESLPDGEIVPVGG